MAAGLGFKTFTTGEVLTAADTNGYLMQGVLVFASAAARDAAITSPQEGQCCYLKDTDAILTYSGTAWVGFDDSNAIQNTIVDAKGDLIGATASDTPARLAVGTNGQVLTADSTEATGLKWSSGAWTTWTPTLGNVVIGNGTITARYQQISKVVFFSVKVVFGSTTTISNSPSITLPVTAASQAYFIANVSDAGVASYTANAILPSADFTRIYMDLIDTTSSRAAAAVFSATSPFTWGTGDNFTVSGSYEVA